MAFKQITDLSADVTISLGGTNKKTGKKNPNQVEGYYLGKREVEDKKKKSGKSYIYFLQTATGNVGVWGKTDMDRKLSAVTPGDMLRVSFDKMVPTPNGEMYKYKVEVDSDNTIEVSSQNKDVETDLDDENSFRPEPSYNEDDLTDDDGEEVQNAALLAAERKAKVEALLRGKNKSAKV